MEILELDELWSNDLCQQRADKELSDRIKVQEQVVMNIIPNYSHQLNDVVTVDTLIMVQVVIILFSQFLIILT